MTVATLICATCGLRVQARSVTLPPTVELIYCPRERCPLVKVEAVNPDGCEDPAAPVCRYPDCECVAP